MNRGPVTASIQDARLINGGSEGRASVQFNPDTSTYTYAIRVTSHYDECSPCDLGWNDFDNFTAPSGRREVRTYFVQLNGRELSNSNVSIRFHMNPTGVLQNLNSRFHDVDSEESISARCEVRAIGGNE